MSGLRVRWTIGVGLLALAAGCGQAAVEQAPAVRRNRPAAAHDERIVPPLRETVLTPRVSLDSAASGPVRVARVRLPAAPRYQVPRVQLADAAVARRINATLTQLLLTDNLEDTTRAATAGQAMQRAQAAYEASGQMGIFTTDYDVLLNRAGLLSLALTVEYSGAYPWAATQHATFEVRAGRLLTVVDLLADTLALRQRWHQRINQRLVTHLREVAHDYPGDSAALATVQEHTRWSKLTCRIPTRDLPPLGEFALTPQGLVLYTRFWFPHAVLALGPDNEYRFALAQVLPWAGPRSPLQRLRR